MKKSVMSRPMFKGEDMEEMDVENVGIMSGFKEDFDEDVDFESMLSELGEDDDMYDSAEMLERRPNSPEILMNNLRGDMRSVDARREELADMVGMEAAMETPDEVLALLQTTLGAGIGALPMDQGPAMAPPEMGMPPAMPPGMPPEMGMPPGMPPEMAAAPPMPPGMPPVNMARGGFVQRFSEGSDEDAVTPAETDASSPALSSEQLQTLQFLINQSRPKTGDLRTAMESRMPIYKELLGGDTREMVQGQALLDIGQGFFNLASNRGPQGEVLRGSGVSRLAGAFRGVPAQVAARAGELSKQEQAVKLAALQSAEKDIELQRTLGARVALEQAKAAARAGKVSGSAFNQYQGLITDFVQGTLDNPGKIRLINTVTEMVQPTEVTVTDKFGNVSKEVRRADIPRSFFEGLVREYGQEAADTWLASLGPDIKVSQIAYPKVMGQGAVITPPKTADAAPSPLETTPSVVATDEEPVTVEGAKKLVDSYKLPSTDPRKETLWPSRRYIAGPINTAQAFFARNFPGADPDIVDKTRMDAIKTNQGLIEALAVNNGRIDMQEQARLIKTIGLTPRVFGGEGAMSTALVSLDEALLRERANNIATMNSKDVLASAQSEARVRVNLIDNYRATLGVPPSIYTEKELQALPVYAEFVDKRNPDELRVNRKDTFSWRNEPAIKEFQKNNPGKQYAVILPNNRGVKIYTAPGKTK